MSNLSAEAFNFAMLEYGAQNRRELLDYEIERINKRAVKYDAFAAQAVADRDRVNAGLRASLDTIVYEKEQQIIGLRGKVGELEAAAARLMAQLKPHQDAARRTKEMLGDPRVGVHVPPADWGLSQNSITTSQQAEPRISPDEARIRARVEMQKIHNLPWGGFDDLVTLLEIIDALRRAGTREGAMSSAAPGASALERAKKLVSTWYDMAEEINGGTVMGGGIAEDHAIDELENAVASAIEQAERDARDAAIEKAVADDAALYRAANAYMRSVGSDLQRVRHDGLRAAILALKAPPSQSPPQPPAEPAPPR